MEAQTLLSEAFVCSNCAELEARLLRVQVAKEEDAHNFAVDLANKNREIGRLKRQLEEFLDETPNSKLAKSLFAYWAEKCGKGPRTVYGTARKKAIQAALKQHDADTIRKAIDGCALKPFVGPHGRQSSPEGGKRFDDLTLILRDETTIERFGGYVDAD